ncbi:MAG TPA: glycosyltransferase family 2 protein [Candidatus Dojkabacteria bacterium]|nr:glycosyltransferase family 2 protein [Candidatus Dojkabacteria bacterium]HRP36345.1 glycosyltransferase family 2 protein [Candidatus Dojkabacteria bacterium]HRP50971.1 glycosyltransferase family 2 protein [Candidatus Dojkabacteria bacterium]
MKAVKSKHSSHNKGGSVLEGLGSHMEKSDLIKALNEKHNQIKFMQKKIDTLQKENRSLTRVIQSNTPSTITILINKILPYEKTKSKVISLLRIYKYAGLAVFINHIASKIVGKQYIGLEEIEYLRWQKKFEINVFKDLTNRIDSVPADILFSVIIPTYNTSPNVLEDTIQSVKRQLYGGWELCIYDDASSNSETIEYLNSLKGMGDERIKVKFGQKNGHISYATNQALELATGKYVLFLDHDDQLSKYTLLAISDLLSQKPKTDIVYYDEDKLNQNGFRVHPHFKPAWSPDTLLSTMYLAHSTYRTSLIRKLGGMRLGYEGSQDYDLALRATELTDNIERIPMILYHWRQIPGSTALTYETKDYASDSSKKAVKDAIKRRGLKATVEPGLTAPSSNISYKIIGNPKISIIIPTKDKLDYIKTAIDSIEAYTSYKNYEIIIVDNNSEEASTKEYLKNIAKKHKILEYKKPYNYAAINNFAVKEASGKHILLLNNDVRVINNEWLTNLLRFSQLDNIGAVGSLLLFRNDTIQHAGVVIGIGGIASHIYREQEITVPAHLDFPRVTHNVSAVTGACLMVKKDLYEKVGGLDEKLAVAFNDVDLCLKLLKAGYKNIYTPFSKLYHYESISRGYEHLDPTQEYRFTKEINYFYKKWKKYIQEGDPYYNPNLSLIHNDGRLTFGEQPTLPKL